MLALRGALVCHDVLRGQAVVCDSPCDELSHHLHIHTQARSAQTKQEANMFCLETCTQNYMGRTCALPICLQSSKANDINSMAAAKHIFHILKYAFHNTF